MQPHNSNLQLLPKPVVNTAARRAAVNALLAASLTVIGFLVLWAPYYLLRADSQLVLAPFVLICVPVIWIFAVRAIVFGRRGRRWAALHASAPASGGRASGWSVVTGVATIVAPLPLFIFGALPLQLLGGA
jgi:cytochrome bd-type quinol oxidase subunit 2